MFAARAGDDCTAAEIGSSTGTRPAGPEMPPSAAAAAATNSPRGSRRPRRCATVPPDRLLGYPKGGGRGGGVDPPDLALPWSLVLRTRLLSLSGSAPGGAWIVDDPDRPAAVAHAIPDTGRGGRRGGWIYLFSHLRRTAEAADGDGDGEFSEAAARVAAEAVRTVARGSAGWGATTSSVMFSALDRRLLPSVRRALSEECGMGVSFVSECGMYTYTGPAGEGSAGGSPPSLPGGVALRPLRESDAELVNSRWEYRSDDSIRRVRDMIAASGGDGGCLGIEVNGTLVAWALRYLDGAVGVVWTEEGHRRRGYASALLSRVMDDWDRQREGRGKGSGQYFDGLFAFIVDENDGSRALFEGLGWRRSASADWVGFTLQSVGGCEGGGEGLQGMCR